MKEQELAGGVNAKINSGKARQRADELEGRLQKRTHELEQERNISASSPVVIGGSIVVPAGLIRRLQPVNRSAEPDAVDAETRRAMELCAMQLVIETEKRLGYEPRDVSALKCGYDVESS